MTNSVCYIKQTGRHADEKYIFYFYMFAEGAKSPILLTLGKSYECNLIKSDISSLSLQY